MQRVKPGYLSGYKKKKKKGLSLGVVVFKIRATYLPNFFLTARAVLLGCTVFVSTSPISSCSSGSSKFQESEALGVGL